MVKINGELVEADGKSVTDILNELGFSSQRVAVELNEEIVSKSAYDSQILSDEDCVEIVRFVGGG